MKGKCYYCNEELTERTVKRHVKGCKVRKEKIKEAMASSKKTKSQYVLSIVPQYGLKEYCLYIAIDIDSTLENLDSFLRDIWLECCGHLSSFIIGDVNYDSSVEVDSEFFSQDETMDFKLKQVISVGDKFRYDYDFGSTTTLKLEVIDEYLTGEKHSEIEILARNEEIHNFCANCNKQAEYFDYEEEKFFCEDCIDQNIDRVDAPEYTNSPRDGVCGYEGDRDTEEQYLPGNNFNFKKVKIKRQKSIVPFIEDDEFDTYNSEEDFDFLLHSAMNDIDLEIKNKAIEMFNKVKRGKFTHDLRELLECNTKTELLKIASILNITKVSKLNKGQLVERLLDVYEEKITQALYLIDSERFEFLKNIADKQGYISFEDDHNFPSNPEYYLEHGFLFAAMGEDGIYLIMPNETINAIKSLDNDEYRKILAKNTELVKLFWGMTYNYGVVFINDFITVLHNYVDYSLDETDLYGIIVSGADYYGEYIVQGNIASSIMAPLEDVVNIINTRENISSDRDFCIIKKEELLEAANVEYLIKNKISMRLKKYLKNNWQIIDTEIEMIIINLYSDIQENEKEEVIENIIEALGEASGNDLQKLLVEINSFLNNIRLWRLKGYTLNELNSEDNNTSTPKIGRNDPCICGSGKKYKKCCGSKVIQLF